MKKILTTLLAFGLCLSSYAQTTVYDSVYMGAGYANQIYYSLPNDSVGSTPTTSWDLGFTTNFMDGSILVNHVKGILVYKVPGMDTSAWATLDTIGITTWKKFYNSDQSWSKGAFNVSANPAIWQDFGWGIYDDQVSHDVIGDDSLYVLQTLNGFKKLRIIIKSGSANTTMIRIADLDNSNDHLVSISGGPYVSKNFVYYNIATNSIIDIEPAKSTWDILFTQYRSIPVNPGPSVTGVFSNIGVKVAKAAKVDTATVDYSAYSGALSSSLSAIGYDWKTHLGAGVYSTVDSLVYFIKTNNNTVYKLWFVRFGGATNGKIVLGKQEVQFASSAPELNDISTKAAAYPNPSVGMFDIVYSTTKNADATVSVFDLTGRNVWNEKVRVNDGLNIIPVSMKDVTPGSYFVKVMQDGSVVNLKMIITK